VPTRLSTSPSPRRPALLALTGVAVAATLALTACGSSGGGQPAGGSGPTGGDTTTPMPAGTASMSSMSSMSSSSAPMSAPAAVTKLVPSSIAGKGTLTIAMDATYPPDEMIASDGHTIEGFDADLGTALAAAMGLKAQLQNVTFDNIIPGLQDGKYDMGLSSFTDTKAREKVVDFVDYFKAGEAFYVKSGSGKSFNGLASLCGATVAVENGTTEQTDAQNQAKKCPSSKKLTVQSFADQNQANLAVSSGRADVGFVDSQIAGYIAKQSNGQFQVTGKAFEVAPYGIALPKGNGMAKAVQAALEQLIKNGTYQQLLKKWGVQSGGITKVTLNGAIS
jgi:polar amino acid transport system substrate-binding protein